MKRGIAAALRRKAKEVTVVYALLFTVGSHTHSASQGSYNEFSSGGFAIRSYGPSPSSVHHASCVELLTDTSWLQTSSDVDAGRPLTQTINVRDAGFGVCSSDVGGHVCEPLKQ